MVRQASRSAGRSSERSQQSSRAPARSVGGRAKKISITVDESVLRQVRHVIRATGRTLSAHVSEALARDLRRRQLQQLIDEYESAHGAITAKELAEARQKWQG